MDKLLILSATLLDTARCQTTNNMTQTVEVRTDARILKTKTAEVVKKCDGDKRAPYTCNQDFTHRVCATLVDEKGPLKWGNDHFWGITGQSPHSPLPYAGGVGWAKALRLAPNEGNGWCICILFFFFRFLQRHNFFV